MLDESIPYFLKIIHLSRIIFITLYNRYVIFKLQMFMFVICHLSPPRNTHARTHTCLPPLLLTAIVSMFFIITTFKDIHLCIFGEK